jgi:hypothetical protein
MSASHPKRDIDAKTGAHAVAELKTKATEVGPTEFLRSIADPQQREDALALMKLMQEATKAKPKMWGASIVGFGNYRCKYASGRELDWFLAGFSPRKKNLTVYLMAGFEGYGDLLRKLGKHQTGKGCLYIKRLQDIDLGTLRQLVKSSVAALVEHQTKDKK